MTDPARRGDDVRMRGFLARTPVATARQWIDALDALAPVTLPVGQAHARILARTIIANIDVPPLDRAALNGYALDGARTIGAGAYNPLSFTLAGEARPGQPFEGELPPGAAIRIMTGGALPVGADAILPLESARESGSRVEVVETVAPGANINRRGEDVAADSTLLEAGRWLRPQDLGLLASTGLEQVEVTASPRVRLLTTGNELVAPGSARAAGGIFDANSAMLTGLIQRDCGALEAHHRLADDYEAIRAALETPGADVVLISGGSSVGREDFGALALSQNGELAVHGVNLYPAASTGFGRLDKTRVFLLPGNPVACLCAYDFFAGRAIRRLGGRSPDWPYASRKARLAGKLVSSVGFVDYWRVRLTDDGVKPIALGMAADLSSTTRADGFVIVPSGSEGYAAGTEVAVHLYAPDT